ncbi:MAG: dihydroneopterin aldolase [Saprospiraceae bacterium]
MNGTINIKDLELYANIGAATDEKDIQQKIVLNIHIKTDIKDCIINDDINKTINYVDTINLCKTISKEKFNLIETMAYKIGSEIMKSNSQIKKLTLTLSKPQVQTNSKLDSVSVKLKF